MVQRIRHKSQHEINVDHWQEVTAWFMDGPGRLIKKVKSEKMCYDPDFKVASNTETSTAAATSEVEAATSETSTSATASKTVETVEVAASTVSTLPVDSHRDQSDQRDQSDFLFNLIDSPGHVDFSSEVTAVKVQKVKVVSQDTFTAALELKAEGYNPLLLNMANAQNPGGGVYKGSMAQEEDLFRRSNYFQVTSLQDFYPLGELEVIYSPNVAVYKNPDYMLLPELTSLSCIACAAERDPKTIVNPEDPQNPFNRLYEDEHVAEITKKRIETIFQVGLKKGHDSLVLGGLGCGAFNNPQMRIIEYFNDLLRIYRPHYKKIVFAVLSKRDPNFDLFSEYIETEEQKVPKIAKKEPRKILRLPPPKVRPYRRVTIKEPTIDLEPIQLPELLEPVEVELRFSKDFENLVPSKNFGLLEEAEPVEPAEPEEEPTEETPRVWDDTIGFPPGLPIPSVPPGYYLELSDQLSANTDVVPSKDISV